MSNYKKLIPHVLFKNKQQMDEEITKHRQSIGYHLNKTDNKILTYMQAHAVRYTGVFYQLVETIANKTGVSVSTVKRVLAKLTKLNIVKRIPTIREKQGGKGATIFQFQFFKPQSEPLQVSHCKTENEPPKPCESKADEIVEENKPFISSKKSSFITNTTEASKKKLLKQGLLSKLPAALTKAIEPFFDTVEDLYNIVGTVFRAKAKVNKSIRIEDHEAVYRKSILSVFSSWNRAMKKHVDFNVFAVMYKAIAETTEAIVNGTAYQTTIHTPSNRPRTNIKEQAPDWMDTDYTKYAQRELVPGWMTEDSDATSLPKENSTIDFEAERLAILAKLGM